MGGRSIERMKAEVVMQEAFVMQREEEANCHEQAIKLRRMKLVQMRLGVKLKERVMAARARELELAEVEHEEEVETYRSEVEEIKSELKEKEAVARRQLVALQQQKKKSFQRLDLEGVYRKANPPTRPWHHMPPPGGSEGPGRTVSMPVPKGHKGLGPGGSVKNFFAKAASFAVDGDEATPKMGDVGRLVSKDL